MKKPEPWPVTGPRPPRGRRPGGRPSGPPKRRKKRSIGEPGWNGESSLLLSSFLASFSWMLTLTEITDGFTRSTMSAKPTGCATLLCTSLLTCACAALVKMSTGRPDGPNAVDGDAEARDDGRHQRKFARRQKRARLPIGRERREVGRTFGHAVILQIPRIESTARGCHPSLVNMGFVALQRAGGGVKLW